MSTPAVERAKQALERQSERWELRDALSDLLALFDGDVVTLVKSRNEMTRPYREVPASEVADYRVLADHYLIRTALLLPDSEADR